MSGSFAQMEADYCVAQQAADRAWKQSQAAWRDHAAARQRKQAAYVRMVVAAVRDGGDLSEHHGALIQRDGEWIAPPGSTVDEAASVMVAIVAVTGEPLSVEFNGSPLIVTSDDISPAVPIQRWHSARSR